MSYRDSLDWKDYGAKYIVDALKPMIEGLQEKGFEFVPISQLIYTENYEFDHEGRQFQKK